jgi:hypothetical protein
MTKMTKFTLMAVVALLVVGFAVMQIGANWTDATHVNSNSFTSGNLVMDVSKTADGAGTESIDAVWTSPANWEPGGPIVVGTVYFKNRGSADVNIVSSSFALTGSDTLANNICVMEISDSTGTTSVADFAGAKAAGNTGCLTLKEISAYLANGYFSNGPGKSGIYVASGADGSLTMKLGFKSAAGNDTMLQTAGFTWTLTAEQVPDNPNIQ